MNYETNQIGNMDKTPMNSDMPLFCTIYSVGGRTIAIKITGNEKEKHTTFYSLISMFS